MNLRSVYARILDDSSVSLSSIHGPRHWARVERNGLYLSEHANADPTIVRLFAVLHDCMRLSEGSDPEHGRRAAEYAGSLRGALLPLSDGDFEILAYAIRWHTEGNEILDDTIGVCWDADRLDLRRVGIQPNPSYLFTSEAKRIAGAKDWESLEEYKPSGLATYQLE